MVAIYRQLIQFGTEGTGFDGIGRDVLMEKFAQAVEVLFPSYRSPVSRLFALDGLGRKPMQESLVGTIGDD